MTSSRALSRLNRTMALVTMLAAVGACRESACSGSDPAPNAEPPAPVSPAPPQAAPGGERAMSDGSATEDAAPPAVFVPESDAAAPAVGRARPDEVVMRLFGAASDGRREDVLALCAPTTAADGSQPTGCAVGDFEAFVERFAAGAIAGPAVVSADGRSAQISLHVGPGGAETTTAHLVRRSDGWYLTEIP